MTKEFKVVLTIDEKGELHIESNIDRLSVIHLMSVATQRIIEGEKAEKEEVIEN